MSIRSHEPHTNTHTYAALIVAWRRSRLVFLGPCFSFSFPTVTGTEIDASQRQADGRKMPPRPLEKQIRLVECGTGLDPSCTKHGGGGEGEGRKRFRNQDLSDLSHGGESGCRAWGSQVLRMSPFKVRGGGVARIKDGRHSTGGGGKMLHRMCLDRNATRVRACFDTTAQRSRGCRWA